MLDTILILKKKKYRVAIDTPFIQRKIKNWCREICTTHSRSHSQWEPAWEPHPCLQPPFPAPASCSRPGSEKAGPSHPATQGHCRLEHHLPHRPIPCLISPVDYTPETYTRSTFPTTANQGQAATLMNAFKPQRELRRTLFDRSEEGTKYNSPERETYSIISSSPLPSPIWAIFVFQCYFFAALVVQQV